MPELEYDYDGETELLEELQDVIEDAHDSDQPDYR